jgi:parallel beta-helix repeat protein
LPIAGLVVALSSYAPAERCTVRLSPGGDVQRAIDRLPARTGGRVCLGPGDFRLRRFVSIRRHGVTLSGEGPKTILRLDAGVDSPVIVIGDHARETPRYATAHVTIERLAVVGGGSGGSETHREWPYLTNSGVVVRSGRNVTIRDLDVSRCRSACILTEKETRDVAIEGNRIAGSVWDGISLNRTARARLAGNVVRDNGAAGITVEHLVDSLIRSNLVIANRTHGIYLSDSYRNRFLDNHVGDNVLSGVFLTCAVRVRTPPVACWRDSMSQANAFARNRFARNRVAFTAAPDAAATCRGRRFVPNRSRDDVFAGNPRYEPGPAEYGRCLVFADGPLTRRARAASR